MHQAPDPKGTPRQGQPGSPGTDMTSPRSIVSRVTSLLLAAYVVRPSSFHSLAPTRSLPYPSASPGCSSLLLERSFHSPARQLSTLARGARPAAIRVRVAMAVVMAAEPWGSHAAHCATTPPTGGGDRAHLLARAPSCTAGRMPASARAPRHWYWSLWPGVGPCQAATCRCTGYGMCACTAAP